MHKTLEDGRWQQLSLVEQMANIGSEVHRAISWYQKGERDDFEKSFDRALELLDLTISDPQWSRGRKELTRVREVICDLFYGGNQYNTPFEFLENYFMQFALAARAQK